MNISVIKPIKNLVAKNSFSWLLLLFIPLSVYSVLNLNGVDERSSIFCAICSGSVTLWLFARVPDFLPALFALLMLLLFELAPENITLSGFSSSIFILALSLMGIGIAVVQSGLVLRTGMFLLRHIPLNSIYQQWAVLIVGFLYQSFTFNENKREKIVWPIISSIVEIPEESGRQKNNLMWTTTARDAVHYFSPILLSAAPANLIVLAFLSIQNQSLFTFTFWLYACSVTALMMFVLYLMATYWYLQPQQKVNPNEKAMSEYFQSPGPFSSAEWVALMAIAMLFVSILTQNLHQQPLSHVFLGVFIVLLTISGRDWKDYISKINWGFLLLFASVLGLFSVMKYLQLDLAMASQLNWLSQFMAQQFTLSIFILAVLIVMARKIMSISVVTLIFSFILFPLAAHAGINPWLFGFIILLFASTYRFEINSKGYLGEEINTGNMLTNYVKMKRFQTILWFLRMIAIYLSIPFWQVTGLL